MAIPLTLSNVPDATPYIQYVANNGQTVYPYPFPITQDSDLVVVINGITQNTDSTYSLSGQGNDTGGNVTLDNGSTAGDIVTLYRDIQIERLTQFAQNGGFSSSSFNAEFNNLYLIAQQLEASIGQCLQIPNTNNPAPVTTLIPANYASKYLAFDTHGNPTPALLTSSGTITTALLLSLLSQQTLAGVLTPRTPAEIAVGVTPVNLAMLPGELYRYGTNTTPGTTDMTAAVQNWAAVGGSLTMSFADIVQISSTVTLSSNTSILIAEGATFRTSTIDISLFLATSKTNITVRGGKFQQSVGGTAAHIGLIKFDSCTYCAVDNVEGVGMQWGGVLLSDSSYCRVNGCYFHNWLGSVPDSADVSVYRASSFNMVTNNVCYGGGQHGIMLQDPGSSLIPTRNTVYGNRIGPHTSYGVLSYNIDSGNTYSTIENNEIEGITGTDLSGNAGAGIYVQNTGGVVVSNNTIRNCCTGSTANSLTPAGIGVNNVNSPQAPVVISGNTIIDMANFYGIEIAASTAGAVVDGNSISFAAGVLANIGIYVNASNNVTITGNKVAVDTSITNGTGVFVFANGVNVSNIVLSGNAVLGTKSNGIRVDTSGAFTITNLTVSGNAITGGSAASVPLALGGVALGSIAGNTCSATTTNALSVNGCTQTRITGNAFTTTGTVAVATNGTCTGSYFDKSNYSNTGIVNAATGLICEQLSNATPLTGFSSAIGDRVEQSVPAVASPKGWRCTVAGNPGTWVSEGNL